MLSNVKTAVVALGGNAISPTDMPDTIANQFRLTRESLSAILPLVKAGYNIAITHGNGPQVGNAMLRVELSRDRTPVLPIGICVADTEGGIGYMIAQSLQNRLRRENIPRSVVTIVTQVVVDRDDPAMANPTKFIGQFYTEIDARRFAAERDWTVKQDGDRGWRRVVGSPRPQHIIEGDVIRAVVEDGVIAIAAGGGGIPVYIDDDGAYEGLDVVIDKDRASAVLGHAIGAELLLILTGVDRVAINFGKPDQQFLSQMSLSEARRYLAEGHFPDGSMGPKIDAAIQFIEGGGEKVLITSIEKAEAALRQQDGTWILPD